MKLLTNLALIIAASTLPRLACQGQTVGAGQSGDVVYTVTVADATSTLTNNTWIDTELYHSYNGYPVTAFSTGSFPDISPLVPNVVNIGDPDNTPTVYTYGLVGIDNITTGATTNQSVYLGFSSASTLPVNESFTTFFAPFFNANPDLVASESTIVAGLLNKGLTDNEGGIYDRFINYVGELALSGSQPATTATIGTGQLTLVHFSNGTAFGGSEAFQIPSTVPEPSTWALLCLGSVGLLGLTLRRRRCAWLA